MGFRISHRMILAVSLTAVCVVLSNQFVVKKKPKVPSTSKFKEQCCERYTQVVQLVPDIMHATADVQTIAFDTLQRYCEGDASCLGANMSKEQLIKYNKILNDMADVCQNFTTEITALLKQINALKSI